MKRPIFHICLAFCLLSSAAVGAQEVNSAGNAEFAPDSTEWQPAYPLSGSVYALPWRMGYAWNPAGMGYGIPISGPLHYGLNAELGAGVRVGWGRNNPWRGASFFTDIGALYAQPISKDGRWTAAVGGYYSNYRLWGEPVNRIGLMGMVDYRINEKLNLAGFAVHDFGALGGCRQGAPFLWPTNYGILGYGPATTVGADLGIRVSEKFALNVGISMTRQQSDFPFGQNPVPPARQQTMYDSPRN